MYNKLNLEFTESNYNLYPDRRSPTILELRKTDSKLAEYAYNLTNESPFRSKESFRKTIRQELIPVLPKISNLEDDYFLHRNLNESDTCLFDLNIGEVRLLDNHFRAFYLNGIRCGGLFGVGIEVFCQNFKTVSLLGSLSQVPTEKEVLVEGGVNIRLLHSAESYEDLLATDHITSKSLINYIERALLTNPTSKSRYLLIEIV